MHHTSHRQTRILTPLRNRNVGHQPQKHWKKLNHRLQQSLPKILPFFWSNGYSSSPRPVRVRQPDLPPTWKTLCVLSSHMFLTLSRINTYVCFKRHSTMQLHTWTLAVRYYKTYYYVEGVCSIPGVTLSSRDRVQDHLLCMIRHLVIQCCWVVESSMSLLPYGVRIIRGKTWFIRRKSEKGPDQRFDSNTRRKQIKILTQITKNIGIFSTNQYRFRFCILSHQELDRR